MLIFVLALAVSDFFLLKADWQNSHRQFTFAMLDVGQGDALLIESPAGTQILVDGGPPRKILGPLSKAMPLLDRQIDAIVITNPDQDHIGGFMDVLEVYQVDKVFESGTQSDSKIYQNLKMEIKKQKIPEFLARRGMRLDLGGGAYIDILFPDRDVSAWTTNDGSVVGRLTYKNISIILSCDATAETEKLILAENAIGNLKSGILKVGHHGSRTSTSEKFVRAVAPSYALISAGKDNKYGHPHQGTLDTLGAFGAKIFSTDLLGSIIVQSDGTVLRWRYVSR